MASFQQDVGNPDIPPGATYVERGVQDDSVSSAVALVGNTAVELARGKATAELTGEANNSNEATTLPSDIEADLNMSQLTAARRNGDLTAAEYTARLQANQRRVIAKYPMFAKSIRERGETFFAGSLDRSKLFTDPTTRQGKTLEQQIEEDTARAIARAQTAYEIRSADTKIPVEVLKELDRESMIADYETKALKRDAAQGKVTGYSWSKSATSALSTAQTDLMGRILIDFNRDGGLSPEKINAYRTAAINEANKVDAEFRQIAPPGTDFGEFNAKRNEFVNTISGLLDNNTFEKILKSKAGALDSALTIAVIRDAPLLSQLSKIDGGVELYSQMGQNEKLAALVRQTNPGLAARIDNTMASSYVGNIILKLGVGDNLDDREAVVAGGVIGTALNLPNTDPKQGPTPQELMAPQVAPRVPRTLYEWNTPTVKRKVLANAEHRNLLLNTAQSVEAVIVSNLRSGAGKITDVQDVGGRISITHDGDVPMQHVRAYASILENYPTVFGKPGETPADTFRRTFLTPQPGVGSTQPPAGDSGIIDVDEQGRLINPAPQATPAPAAAAPKGETTVIETDVTPGVTENVEAQTKSAVTSHAREAAKVYAEMVASGKNPEIGEVLSGAGSLGFVIFSLDRKKWTSEFDAALPEGVAKPSWGIR